MADVRWIGAALDVNDIWTITVSGAWATGDTFSLSIGNSTLIITVGTLSAAGDVAAAISAALGASDSDDGIIGTESRNVGGRQIPELLNIDATVAGGVVTLLNSVAGDPFIITRVDVTAGSGTTTLSNSQAATGRSFIDNAANWEGGALPGNGDTARADSGSVPMLHALTYFRDNTIDISLLITTDYLGSTGLPETNQNGSFEYRNRYLQLYETGGNSADWVTGEDFGLGGGPYFIDLDGQDFTVQVLDAGSLVTSSPAVVLAGGTFGLTVRRGYVVVEPDDSPATTPASLTSIVAGASDLQENETTLVVGVNATWNGAIVTSVHSGNVFLKADTFTSISPDIHNEVKAHGGEVTFDGTGASGGNWFSTAYDTGRLVLLGPGTYQTMNLIGGTADLNQDARAKTITSLVLYPGASFLDRANTATLTAINVIPQSLDELTIEGNLGL